MTTENEKEYPRAPVERLVMREIGFFPPDTHPEYANESDYILLLEITEEGEDSAGDEEMMIAQWIDNKWWVYADTYEPPEREKGQHNEYLQPVLFEMFEEGFFKLKGWSPIWNGAKPPTHNAELSRAHDELK